MDNFCNNTQKRSTALKTNTQTNACHPPMEEGPKEGVVESQDSQDSQCARAWSSNDSYSYLYWVPRHARHFAQTIPLILTRTHWDRYPHLIWQMDARWPVSNPHLVVDTAGIWTNPGLPVFKPRPLPLRELPPFLGQSTRPAVLQASSMLALVLPPCRQPRGSTEGQISKGWGH